MNEIFLNHNETIQVEKIRAEIDENFSFLGEMVKGCDVDAIESQTSNAKPLTNTTEGIERRRKEKKNL